jgi:hypothetical protein
MPKILRNNRLSQTSALGRVLQHDLWVNQDLTTTASPTFANLHLTGDSTIDGNLYVYGNTTILDTNVIETEDNIILLNRGESGNGVTLNLAGIEIDRGPGNEMYRAVFQESDGTYRIGFGNDLQRVTTLEDSPLVGGILTWDPIKKYIVSTDSLQIDIKFLATTNSTSSSTGSIVTTGGLGVKKDITIDGAINLTGNDTLNTTTLFTDSTNNFNINSTSSIFLNAASKVSLPSGIPLVFGNAETNITSTDGNLIVNNTGDFKINSTKARLTKNTPFIFAQTGDFPKMYSDDNSHMVIQNVGADISLNTNTRVLVPVSIPLTFANNNQRIFSNTSNDLFILSGNDIHLRPGFNVRLQTNKGIQLGDTGIQRIYSDPTNILHLTSTSDINLTPSVGQTVNIPSLIGVAFGNKFQQIKDDGAGNLTLIAAQEVKALSNVFVSTLDNATCATTGSLHTNGGIGVKKDIFVENNAIVRSDSSSALQIGNWTNNNILVVNTQSHGNVKVQGGYGNINEPSLTLSTLNNITGYSLLELISSNDTTPGFNIGRGSQSLYNGRAMTFTLPRYNAYNNSSELPKFVFTSGAGDIEIMSMEGESKHTWFRGQVELTDTLDSSEESSGSLFLHGGMSVTKNGYFYKDLCIKSNSNTSFTVKNNLRDILSINSNPTVELVHIQGNNTLLQPKNILELRNTNNETFMLFDMPNKSALLNIPIDFTNTKEAVSLQSASVVAHGGVAIQKNLVVNGLINSLGDINLNYNILYNTPMPTFETQVANKGYVDLVYMAQLQIKDACQVATTENVNIQTALQPGEVIDEYTLLVGDRVLVWKQTNKVQNGIYVVPAPGAIVQRSPDMNLNSSGVRVYVFVYEGNENGYVAFICNNEITTPDTAIVGTNEINFVYFYGNTKVIAGLGLYKTGSVLDVVVDNFSIEIFNDALEISSIGISTGLIGGSGEALETDIDQSHVEMLGTINTGTWEASTVQVLYGGTGNEEFTSGSILFGNDSERLLTSEQLHWDNDSGYLGIGNNSPQSKLDVSENSGECMINIRSNANEKVGLQLNKTDVVQNTVVSNILIVGQENELANGSIPDALVLSNKDQAVQIATNDDVRMTIGFNGNVGIATTNPSKSLEVHGDTLIVSDTDSENRSTGAFVNTGGASIMKNLSVGGKLQINSEQFDESSLVFGKESQTKSSIISFLTDTESFLQPNASITCDTIGSLKLNSASTLVLDTEDHIHLLNDTQADNLTTASLIADGGAVVTKNLVVGENLDIQGNDHFIANLHVYSTQDSTFINSLNDARDPLESFAPIFFGNSEEDNTIFTIHSSGTVLNSSGTLQIGGELDSSNGFVMSYNNNELTLDSKIANEPFIIGSKTNTDVQFDGINESNVYWDQSESTLEINNSVVLYKGSNSSGSGFVQHLPFNNENVSYLQAQNENMTINHGQNGSHELSTVFSNQLGTAQISLLMNTTTGHLITTTSVSTSLNGNVQINNKLTLTGNAEHYTINNATNTKVWYFLNRINTTEGSAGPDENGTCHIRATTRSSNVLFSARIVNGELIPRHMHFDEYLDSIIFSIYRDTQNNYYLFLQIEENTFCNLDTFLQTHSAFLYEDRGSGSSPMDTSGFVEVYNTANNIADIPLQIGNFVSDGESIKFADTFPIIGYNNSSVIESRDLGILMERYQNSNDISSGELIETDTPFATGNVQSPGLGQTDSQVKIQTIPGMDLTDSWIYITGGNGGGQVRKIMSYNSSNGFCSIDTPWTLAPEENDTYDLYNRNYISLYWDNSKTEFGLGYTKKKNADIIDYANLELYKLVGKEILIDSAFDSTSLNNASIITNGGASIVKNLKVGQNIGIGIDTDSILEPLHIRKQNSNVLLESNLNQHSYIQFKEHTSNKHAGILFEPTDYLLSLTIDSTGDNPVDSFHALTINSGGYVGINTTSDINSPLTLLENNFISTTSNDGYIGLISSNTNLISNTASKMVMYGNEHATKPGHVDILANKEVNIGSNGDNRMNISSTGKVSILSTNVSYISGDHAFFVNGNVLFNCTENAIGFSSGGSFTVSGGAAIQKDTYIGGNLIVNGDLDLRNAISSPNLTLDNPTNCIITGFENATILKMSDYVELSFVALVVPIVGSANTQFEVVLPEKVANITKRTDVIGHCSGWMDDTSLFAIQNIVATGIVGDKRALVKFQSASTSLHYLQIVFKYRI